MMDWKIFKGEPDLRDGVPTPPEPHDDLLHLPDPPPWRFSRAPLELSRPTDLDLKAEASRAEPFIPSRGMVIAVNLALYLRRPLLLTGKPGTGKSTLIAKVAHELRLGPVVRWPINSRSTVRSGVYDYDAVGRLQTAKQEDGLPIEEFLTLAPLGTALCAQTWPRPLLVDEIDKSDLDFANDLLNVIEEGTYEIPELRRIASARPEVRVRDWLGNYVTIRAGRITAGQFPFVIMTSNGEREFPPAFLRRCIRFNVENPTKAELETIVRSHLQLTNQQTMLTQVTELIDEFDRCRKENREVSTDQLLNAVFLTVALRDKPARTFDETEFNSVRENLFQELVSPSS
jgi:MoxR-like ATPase